MGHADVQTTMRYLHYAPRHDDAALVAHAFRREAAPDPLEAVPELTRWGLRGCSVPPSSSAAVSQAAAARVLA